MMIFGLTFGLIFLPTVSAPAAEWHFYGSSRVAMFQVETDAPGISTDNFDMGLHSNARIGAKIRVSDTLSGTFEYGASGGNANLRKLFGEWDFGAGKLLVGHTYSPLNWAYSNQVFGTDNNLKAQGMIYSGREPMLQLTLGGFQIAAIQPDTDDLGTGYATEADRPAVEASYTFAFDSVTLAVGGGYSAYEIINGAVTYDIDSHVLAASARFKLGAAFVNGTVFTGRNPGNLIPVSVTGDNRWDDGFAVISGNRVLDNDSMGYGLSAGYKLNNRFTFEAGYGFVTSEVDTVAGDDEARTYYANTTVTLAPGVFFVPEIGRFDGVEATDAETTYYGIKWQINF
jgi:hypothetical protein